MKPKDSKVVQEHETKMGNQRKSRKDLSNRKCFKKKIISHVDNCEKQNESAESLKTIREINSRLRSHSSSDREQLPNEGQKLKKSVLNNKNSRIADLLFSHSNTSGNSKAHEVESSVIVRPNRKTSLLDETTDSAGKKTSIKNSKNNKVPSKAYSSNSIYNKNLSITNNKSSHMSKKLPDEFNVHKRDTAESPNQSNKVISKKQSIDKTNAIPINDSKQTLSITDLSYLSPKKKRVSFDSPLNAEGESNLSPNIKSNLNNNIVKNNKSKEKVKLKNADVIQKRRFKKKVTDLFKEKHNSPSNNASMQIQQKNKQNLSNSNSSFLFTYQLQSSNIIDCPQCHEYFGNISSLINHKCYEINADVTSKFTNANLRNNQVYEVHNKKKNGCNICGGSVLNGTEICNKCINQTNFSKKTKSSNLLKRNTSEKSKQNTSKSQNINKAATLANVLVKESLTEKLSKRNVQKKSTLLENVISKTVSLETLSTDLEKDSNAEKTSKKFTSKKVNSLKTVSDEKEVRNSISDKLLKRKSMSKIDALKPSKQICRKSFKSAHDSKLTLGTLSKSLQKHFPEEDEVGVAFEKNGQLKCLKCDYLSSTSIDACFHYKRCQSHLNKSLIITKSRVRWLCMKCSCSFSGLAEMQQHVKSCTVDDLDSEHGSVGKSLDIKVMKRAVQEAYQKQIKYYCSKCGTGYSSKFSLPKHDCESRLSYTKSCFVALPLLTNSEMRRYNVRVSGARSFMQNYPMQDFSNKSHCADTLPIKIEVEEPTSAQRQMFIAEDNSTNFSALDIKSEITGDMSILQGNLSDPKNSYSPFISAEPVMPVVSLSYTCNECTEPFPNQQDFEFHIENKHGHRRSVETNSQCVNCKLLFSSQVFLNHHKCERRYPEYSYGKPINTCIPIPIMSQNVVDRKLIVAPNGPHLTGNILYQTLAKDSITCSGMANSNQLLYVNAQSYFPMNSMEHDSLAPNKPLLIYENSNIEKTKHFETCPPLPYGANNICLTKNSFSSSIPHIDSTESTNPLQCHALIAGTSRHSYKSGSSTLSPNSQLSGNVPYCRTNNHSQGLHFYTCNLQHTCGYISEKKNMYSKGCNSLSFPTSNCPHNLSCDLPGVHMGCKKDFSNSDNLPVQVSCNDTISSVETISEGESSKRKFALSPEKVEILDENALEVPTAWPVDIAKNDRTEKRYICEQCFDSCKDKDDLAIHSAIEHNSLLSGKFEMDILSDSSRNTSTSESNK